MSVLKPRWVRGQDISLLRYRLYTNISAWRRWPHMECRQYNALYNTGLELLLISETKILAMYMFTQWPTPLKGHFYLNYLRNPKERQRDKLVKID